MTSLCGVLYNGGVIVASDMQATARKTMVASEFETKIYQVGRERIVLAGTGSVDGILEGKRKVTIETELWKSNHSWEDIPHHELGEILKKVMIPEDEAYFLCGMFDYQTGQGKLTEVAETGTTWRHQLVQVHGSGTPYMASLARLLQIKVFAASSKVSFPTSTERLYRVLPEINFCRDTAMLETLNVIAAGPTSDVYSGGNGFQMMVIDQQGVGEYIIPIALAREILEMKAIAEISAISPSHKLKKLNTNKIRELFSGAIEPYDKFG